MIVSFADKNTERLAGLQRVYRLAKDIGVPPQRIGEIVAGKRSVTADTDLRLCKYFGLTPGYWLRAQNKYDTALTRRKIQKKLDSIVTLNHNAPI